MPNSINIGIDGSFAPWVGSLIPGVAHPLLIVTDEGREEEVVTRLARVGYDYSIGYLKGGFEAWMKSGKEVDTIKSINAEAFAQILAENPNALIADVRKKSEYDAEHIPSAENLPLDFINESMPVVPMAKYKLGIEQIRDKAHEEAEFTTLNHIYILEEMHQFLTGRFDVSKERVAKMLAMKKQLGMVNSFTMHHFFISLKLLKKPQALKFWEKRFIGNTIKLISNAAKLQAENNLAKSWLLKGLKKLKGKFNF